jgi:hypothetical protein
MGETTRHTPHPTGRLEPAMRTINRLAHAHDLFALAAARVQAVLPVLLRFSVIVAAAALLGAGYAAALAWDWISDLR